MTETRATSLSEWQRQRPSLSNRLKNGSRRLSVSMLMNWKRQIGLNASVLTQPF